MAKIKYISKKVKKEIKAVEKTQIIKKNKFVKAVKTKIQDVIEKMDKIQEISERKILRDVDLDVFYGLKEKSIRVAKIVKRCKLLTDKEKNELIEWILHRTQRKIE